jgi:acyl-CoA synthetase (AMP-forming)/AMP-acid ligase II
MSREGTVVSQSATASGNNIMTVNVVDGVTRSLYGQSGSMDTMVSLLRGHADRHPDRLAYVFLGDGEVETARLTFAELDYFARALAVQFADRTAVGDRALLLYPPGLEFVKALFGCHYAGVVPVPVHPPSRHHVDRLRSIVEDADSKLVLSPEVLKSELNSDSIKSWLSAGSTWCTTDAWTTEPAATWSPPNINSGSLALLQYTSGSTGRPKGVIVSHGNLLANEEAMRMAFGHDETSTVVGWLPLYHDMGLIGNLLQPLYVGATAILMPPMTFLERPARWLRAISKYHARTSGGPNFAYELCLRKISATDRKGLDLSSWSLAFNGSEPIRASTLERFSAAFAEYGFRRSAFQPCYGLAEATLLVSTPTRGRAPTVRSFDKLALSSGIATTETHLAEASERLVGCGVAPSGHAIMIVDPASQLPCPDGKIGEIWFRGPSAAKGYWRQDSETDRVFHAHGSDAGESRFVRTGDLGFIVDKELFVAGRIKDLIILRGRNYYPADLEQVLDEMVAGLRPGCNAAFLAPGDSTDAEEHLVLVAEVQRDYLRTNGEASIFQAIRAAIAASSDIGIGEIVLAQPSSIPKTTSGKVRRNACRDAYLKGTLSVFARTRRAIPPSGSGGPAESAQTARSAEIEKVLRQYLVMQLRCSDAELRADTTIHSLGLNSLQLVELKHALDAALRVDLPLAVLFSTQSIPSLAVQIAALPAVTGSDPALNAKQEGLSFAQRAMWTVHKLDQGNNSYNLHLVLDIDGVLDVARLRVALAILLERHEQLRTTYWASRDTVTCVVQPLDALPEWFSDVDAAGWNIDRLQEDLASRPRNRSISKPSRPCASSVIAAALRARRCFSARIILRSTCGHFLFS